MGVLKRGRLYTRCRLLVKQARKQEQVAGAGGRSRRQEKKSLVNYHLRFKNYYFDLNIQ